MQLEFVDINDVTTTWLKIKNTLLCYVEVQKINGVNIMKNSKECISDID